MTTTYRKTAEGQAEIETRARRLSPRLRSALIMVDGKRTDEELRRLILQQPGETLQALVEQGLIKAVAVTAPAAPAAAETPAAPKPGADFERLRRESVRELNEQLGPEAESLAMKMERAANLETLRPLLERAVAVIGNARGGGAAAKFANRFLEVS